MPTKAELRSQLLIKRKARADRAQTAKQIAELALSLITDQETDLGAYLSTMLEPPTDNLIKILQKDKNLYFPKVINNELSWFKNPQEFAKGSFNILEPVGEGQPIEEFSEITTLFIPAFAVTPSGIRLGKGGGFYDRVFAKLNPKVKKVAIVFDDEIIEDIPSEPHDKRVDFIVSEKRVITITSKVD